MKAAPAQTPALVGSYIAAALWFTASQSFANPAVTIARMFSDTYAGIQPVEVLPYIAAQVIGAVLGGLVARQIYSEDI